MLYDLIVKLFGYRNCVKENTKYFYFNRKKALRFAVVVVTDNETQFISKERKQKNIGQSALERNLIKENPKNYLKKS